jgi:hypothetical protein
MALAGERKLWPLKTRPQQEGSVAPPLTLRLHKKSSRKRAIFLLV